MADTDLLFGSPATGVSTDLVFGATDAPVAPDRPVTVLVALDPEVSVRAHLAIPVTVAVAEILPVVAINMAYISGAARPLAHERATGWQAGAALRVLALQQHTAALPAPVTRFVRHQQAEQSPAGARVREQSAQPRHTGVGVRQQDGQRLRKGVGVRHQDGVRSHRSSLGLFQQAARVRHERELRHQDGLRDRRNRTAGRWQDGVRHSASYTGEARTAQHLDATLGGRHQQAMKPPPGIWTIPVVPPVDPCYTPSGELVFKTLWDGSPHLVFVCDDYGGGNEPPVATVVVPIKRVYVVLNETSLRRVDGNIPLPTLSMSMSLDVDSWTWSFNATLPGQALADLAPEAPGEPVLVEALINGVPYRMQVEKRSRARAFNQSAIKISGRGLSATLDAPYAPVMNHANTEARTAQQLMNDVLMLNGVSIGWTVDWQAVDWSVPAGLFAHQGVYISALNQIAAAAGSYIQPHRVDQTLHVLPRYPVLPWAWADAVPDYEIPSAVATVEDIEWVDRTVYNRVYVSGMRDGVLGQVTRGGTDGGLVAPMVTDALITTEAAARQRGIPILANTGSQANVSLRMPVLEETGVIQPGKLVRYTDGSDVHLGITRSVQVDVGSPEVWQTIVLETHV